MQEYKDGTFGKIMDAESLKELLDNPDELNKTKAIHFGTVEQLTMMKEKIGQLEEAKTTSVKDYLFRIEKKLNRILIKLDLADKNEFLIV